MSLSIKREKPLLFDESVLLWHIATDFCFFSSPFSEHTCAYPKTPSIWIWSKSKLRSDMERAGVIPPAQKTRSECGQLTACRAVQCRQMSSYMMYLLFVNPEMLLPGTRRNLFATAYDELKDILGDNESCCQQVKEKQLMETLINTMRDKSNKEDPKTGSQEESKEEGQPINGGSQENFIHDAWDLAKGLLKLRDDFGDEKMWEVIQGVWVEMLCFSASRCRGYLHAKALGSPTSGSCCSTWGWRPSRSGKFIARGVPLPGERATLRPGTRHAAWPIGERASFHGLE